MIKNLMFIMYLKLCEFCWVEVFSGVDVCVGVEGFVVFGC